MAAQISRRPTAEGTLVRSPREPWHALWRYECWAALIGLLRSPRYSIPALLSVALSIGAGTAVFSVFSAQVLRPLPFPREGELVQLSLEREDGSGVAGRNQLSAPFAADFRALDSVFASVSLQRLQWGYLTGSTGAKNFGLVRTSPDYFDTLGIEAQTGRVYTARGPRPDGTEGVVVRHGFWLSAFAGEPIIGKKIVVNGEPKVVLGIIADDQALPSFQDIWTADPRVNEGARWPGYWYHNNVARLRPGISVEQAQARLRQLALESPQRDQTGSLVMGRVTPLRDGLVGAQRGSVSLLAAAVVAFALLACANLALLLGTRASVRQRESAVRAALGASRWALMRQSAFEAAILVGAGGVLGLACAVALTRLIAREYSVLLANTPPRLDARVLGSLVLLLLITAGAGTWLPALQARRVQPMDALRGRARSSAGQRSRRVRELLVAIQVAMTLALLVNAGLLVRSIQALLAVDPGFRSEGVAIARVLIPTERLRVEGRDAWVEEAKLKARSLYDRLRELPTLQDLCLASELPLDGLQPDSDFFEPAAAVGGPSRHAHVHWVSPGCFAALGIPLLSGRDFTPNDGLDPRRCIVNRAFAREVFGTEDAVGEQRLRVAGPPESGQTPPPATTCEVIGVVGDVMEDDLVRGTVPAVYLPLFGQPAQHGNEVSLMFAVAMRSAGALDLISSALPEVVDELFPNSVVFDVQALQSSVEGTFQARTALERILVAFGLSALGLAAIGLFGVTAYTVAERSAEIGIRRALGASRRQILLMVLGETAAVVGVGALFGLGLSRLVRGFVESVLYGVTALDPVTHAAVCLGIFVTALGAALIPARAAAVTSPSRALTRL